MCLHHNCGLRISFTRSEYHLRWNISKCLSSAQRSVLKLLGPWTKLPLCQFQEVATQKLNTSKIMFFPDFCPRWGSTREGCVLHLPCCLCQNPEGPHWQSAPTPRAHIQPPVLLIPPGNVTQTHPTLSPLLPCPSTVPPPLLLRSLLTFLHRARLASFQHVRQPP